MEISFGKICKKDINKSLSEFSTFFNVLFVTCYRSAVAIWALRVFSRYWAFILPNDKTPGCGLRVGRKGTEKGAEIGAAPRAKCQGERKHHPSIEWFCTFVTT